MGPVLGLLGIYIIEMRYGQRGVGLYSSFMQFIVLLSVVVRFGSDYVVIKNVSKNMALMQACEVSVRVYKLVFRVVAHFIGVYLLLYFAVSWFDTELLSFVKENYFIFGLALLFFSIFSFLISFLVALDKPLHSIVIQSIFLQISILIFFIILPAEMRYLMVAVGLSSCLLIGVVLYNFMPTLSVNFRQLIRIKNQGFLNGFSSSLSEIAVFNSDILILSFFVNIETVAVYGLCSRFVMLYGFYVQIQIAFFSSKVSTFATDNNLPELKSLLNRILKINAVFLVLYMFGLSIISMFIVKVFGDAYVGILEYLPYLAISGCIGVMFGFSVAFYFLIIDKVNTGRGKRNLVLLIFYLLTMTLLSYFYGVWGTIVAMIALKSIYYCYYFALSFRQLYAYGPARLLRGRC